MTRVDPVDLKRALLVPSAVFESPRAVVRADGLSRDQKLDILRRWEFDARAMHAAEEEDTGGAESFLLAHIRAALRELGAEEDVPMSGRAAV
ncbi:MAG TPA: hypothetical protein VLA75_01700 [Thermoanaerobaculia bacterium]|nr:hypothetical protein [Thermoanaerobaculia bacterium]